MKKTEIVQSLSDVIKEKLTPHITADYWLLEVPYYNNVGDVLIWQGELDFLSEFPYKCKGCFSFGSKCAPKLSDGDLILFQGGGNFGDLWKEPHTYRKSIMAENPNCKYIIFPQTVYYADKKNLIRDADFFAQYDCILCARDNVSNDLLKENFKNDVLLVPDMAFCMDMSKWAPVKKRISSKALVLRREDKEFKSSCELEKITASLDADVVDWLPMKTYSFYDRLKSIILRHPKTLRFLYDRYMQNVYRRYLIQSGINQLDAYNEIYTTRLHACILSILLGKDQIVLFDNSYGKNRSFYDTWLRQCETVEIL